MGGKWHPVRIVIGISQIISEARHLFLCLLAICAAVASASGANAASSGFTALRFLSAREEQPGSVQRVASCCVMFRLISPHPPPAESGGGGGGGGHGAGGFGDRWMKGDLLGLGRGDARPGSTKGTIKGDSQVISGVCEGAAFGSPAPRAFFPRSSPGDA